MRTTSLRFPAMKSLPKAPEATDRLRDAMSATMTEVLGKRKRIQSPYQPGSAVAKSMEVLERMRRVHGDDHPSIISAMNDLASTLESQGHLGEAAAIKKEVLERMQRLLGDDHPSTISVMNGLASTLEGQGHLAEAAAMKKEVLERMQRVFGNEHPSTILAMNSLASTLEGQGHLAEAAAIKKEVLERMQRVLGEDHPSTILAKYNLRKTLKFQDRVVERTKMATANIDDPLVVGVNTDSVLGEHMEGGPHLANEQRQLLLESLRFEQIDGRSIAIKNAHAKTCKWLLHSPKYLAWLDSTKLTEHHGFLWVKGKPGTGKSTLMKFALANIRRTMKDSIVLSFFFNARGHEMEKSTTGTYRSLLLQLLEQIPTPERIPTLQRVFGSLSLSASSISTEHKWDPGTLEAFLEQTILGLKRSPIVCVIDALDECDERQIRDMVSFFERLSELSMSCGVHFRVCFSSRHYPHITIRKGLVLVLDGEEGHSQDITHYLESELKIGRGKIAQQIRSELQQKASGIFIWVVLVVDILNKDHDCGRVRALQRRLREIPRDLHELFRDILTRDSRNREELVLCIQWVLFAREPLSPEQLYFAILSGIEPDALSEWDSAEITEDDIKRFILNCSKGLTDITASKQEKEKVQFIHESVRDYLLKEDSLGNIWPEYAVNLQGQSHERLKQCCLTYMSWGISIALNRSGDSSRASSRSNAARFREVATQTAPFLAYAVQQVLCHADIAEQWGVGQEKFIQTFPLQQWIKLDNLFEKHEIRRHTESMSLLYVLGERNLSNLIRAHGSALSCLEVEEERYGPALFAAMSSGSNEAVKVFLEGLSRDQSVTSLPQEAFMQYCKDRDSQRVFGRTFRFSRNKSILSSLVELGNGPILALVLDTGMVDVDDKGKNGQATLHQAAGNAQKRIVKLLLDKGADVNAQGGGLGSALQAASGGGHEAIVKLLLKNGADVNAQGGKYGNALQAASSRGSEAIVKLLLEKGANVNAQGGKYGNALQAALDGGHEAIVKLLVEKGADVNA